MTLQPPSPPASETERLLADAVAKEKAGQMDEAGLREFDLAMQRQFERDRAAFDLRLADIQRDLKTDARTAGRTLSGRAKGVSAVLLAGVIAGVVFEFTWGSAFVFAFSAQYRAAAGWGFAVVWLSFVVLIVYLKDPTLRSRYPTRWVRGLVVIPLTAALCAWAVVVAPRGWLASGARFFGDRFQADASILTLNEPRSSGRYGCRQTGMLRLRSAAVDVCLSELIVGPVVRAGDAVIVRGRESSLGLYIETISKR